MTNQPNKNAPAANPADAKTPAEAATCSTEKKVDAASDEKSESCATAKPTDTKAAA